MRRLARLALLAIAAPAALLLGGQGVASAAVVFDGSPGTGPPPPRLGPYSLTKFPADARPTGSTVSSVNGPTGTLQFDRLVRHYRIGSGWGSWSHGYRGDVYTAATLLDSPARDSLTLSPPSGTRAFYLYVEPNRTSESFTVTARAQDGSSSGPVPVAGASGARFFGFYATGGDFVTSVRVDVDPDAGGFAVGEFGIARGFAPPRLLSLRLDPKTFRARRSGGAIAPPGSLRGTQVTYVLSRAAFVRFAVERARAGRRVDGRCRRPTRGNRNRPRCTRYERLQPGFSQLGRAGVNAFRFSGRIGGQRLAPGSYRLVAQPLGASGGALKRSFAIVR